MSDPENKAIRSKPVKVNLADVLFFMMGKNLVLFKNLEMKNVHYSIFSYGSTIDVHQTIEGQFKKHTQLAKIELDWEFLQSRMSQDMKANWRSIC